MDNIILGGDLNFSIGHFESWGHWPQRDPLSEYFETTLESHHLIDIPSAKIQATWRNNRTGDDSLAYGLDRFLVKEILLEYGYSFRQWVGSGGIFYHLPIYMEIDGGRAKPKGPYKFSLAWFKEAS